MGAPTSLHAFTEAVADAVPAVDRVTTGQYGDGLGSEDEEHQLELLLDHLREAASRYEEVDREVSYPDSSERCDLVLPNGMPVEAKLIRYWRANGDPEPTMYGHVFSPFHQNTLLTDARRLHVSEFSGRSGLLGLFYKRADDDPETGEALPERYTAEDIAKKVVQDIEYWYETTRACVASPISTDSDITSTDREQSSRGSLRRRVSRCWLLRLAGSASPTPSDVPFRFDGVLRV